MFEAFQLNDALSTLQIVSNAVTVLDFVVKLVRPGKSVPAAAEPDSAAAEADVER